MRRQTNTQRRHFLQQAAGVLVAAAAPRLLIATNNKVVDHSSPDFRPDVEIALTARITTFPVFPGPETTVWRYTGELMKGPGDTLTAIPGSYLGPVLRLRAGQKVRVYFHNALPEPCVVHQHGLHVPEDADGHPRYAIAQGQTYIYDYQVLNRASTCFYHSHTHGTTGHRVYYGLAGPLIVTDLKEEALNLPGGDYDIPLVIQDRRIDDRNQWVYVRHMMERMRGFLGERILVNGKPNFELNVESRAYRLRLINASNSRIYKLAWGDDTPLTVIGGDGGLLECPIQRPYITLAPAERADLWMDFSGRNIGTELTLRSLPFSGVMPRMMGGGMGRGMGGRMGMRGRRHGAELQNGAEFPILKVRVTKQVNHAAQLTERLATMTPLCVADAQNAGHPRTIRLSMRPHSPRLNGRSFGMTEVAADEVVKLNSLQLLVLENRSHRMRGMQMAHPIHLHGQPFQVIKRQIAPGFENDYQTLSGGFIDQGWKDTVLVMPGEKVTLLKRFDDYEGLFLYHCHNMEHEDLDMMRNFQVKA